MIDLLSIVCYVDDYLSRIIEIFQWKMRLCVTCFRRSQVPCLFLMITTWSSTNHLTTTISNCQLISFLQIIIAEMTFETKEKNDIQLKQKVISYSRFVYINSDYTCIQSQFYVSFFTSFSSFSYFFASYFVRFFFFNFCFCSKNQFLFLIQWISFWIDWDWLSDMRFLWKKVFLQANFSGFAWLYRIFSLLVSIRFSFVMSFCVICDSAWMVNLLFNFHE